MCLCADSDLAGLSLCHGRAGSGASVASKTAAWGRASVFFQAFLGAVKNGSSLSPAMAKELTLYSIIAWPDSFLALEQLCALFFHDGALPSLLGAVQAPGMHPSPLCLP